MPYETYFVPWPQIRQPWHREGLTSFGEPYAANAGHFKIAYLVSVPMKPQTDGANTIVVGGLTSLRPRPQAG